MDALKDVLNKFVKLDEKVVLFKTMDNNKHLSKLVTDLNTKHQLRFGILSDGSVLRNYSRTSQLVYNKPDIPIQLKDTGAFWSSFEVILTSDGFIINADGKKLGDNGKVINLFEKYGEDVAGLTDDNIAEFIEELQPLLADEITRQLLS